MALGKQCSNQKQTSKSWKISFDLFKTKTEGFTPARNLKEKSQPAEGSESSVAGRVVISDGNLK